MWEESIFNQRWSVRWASPRRWKDKIGSIKRLYLSLKNISGSEKTFCEINERLKTEQKMGINASSARFAQLYDAWTLKALKDHTLYACE